MHEPHDEAPSTASVDHVFHLPDLGEGLVSAQIVEWLVAEGSEIAIDDPVALVETEKTTVELPAPFAGRVLQCHGAVKDRISVGSPLLTIRAAAGTPGQTPVPAPAETVHLVGQRRHPEPDARGDLLADIRLPSKPERDRVAAAPAVRRLARELGVDLRSVAGTGKGGAISRDDVLAAGRGAEEGVG